VAIRTSAELPTAPWESAGLLHEGADCGVGTDAPEGIFPILGVVVAVERVTRDRLCRPDVHAGFPAKCLKLEVEVLSELPCLVACGAVPLRG
jgi:hypothetical protein